MLILSIKKSFNPRARDGRDAIDNQQPQAETVSIHAPVMDAMIQQLITRDSIIVSIHAPVMDAMYVSLLAVSHD